MSDDMDNIDKAAACGFNLACKVIETLAVTYGHPGDILDCLEDVRARYPQYVALDFPKESN